MKPKYVQAKCRLPEPLWWTCEPIVQSVRAGVMARTPDSHPYRIAVIGRNEQEARLLFSDALASWHTLHDATQETKGTG